MMNYAELLSDYIDTEKARAEAKSQANARSMITRDSEGYLTTLKERYPIIFPAESTTDDFTWTVVRGWAALGVVIGDFVLFDASDRIYMMEYIENGSFAEEGTDTLVDYYGRLQAPDPLAHSELLLKMITVLSGGTSTDG